jgi:hypothetical protein
MGESHAFKAVLGMDSVRGIQSNLVLNVNETGGGITKDHGTAELVSMGLASSSMEETSLDPRLKVVAENTVTWEEHVSFEVANNI